jgi:transcriptional regulator with XRE-family HTH domain
MRQELGISQEAFAQLAKLDRSYFGRIERGTQNLTLSTLCVIALALRVPPAVIIADLTLAHCVDAKQDG